MASQSTSAECHLGGSRVPKRGSRESTEPQHSPGSVGKLCFAGWNLEKSFGGNQPLSYSRCLVLQRVLFPVTQKYYCTPHFPRIHFLPPPTVRPSSSCCSHPGPSYSSYSTLFPGLKHHVLYSQLCMGCPLSLSPLTGRPERNHVWYNLCSQWLEKWLAHHKMLCVCLLNWTYHSPSRQMAIS